MSPRGRKKVPEDEKAHIKPASTRATTRRSSTNSTADKNAIINLKNGLDTGASRLNMDTASPKNASNPAVKIAPRNNNDTGKKAKFTVASMWESTSDISNASDTSNTSNSSEFYFGSSYEDYDSDHEIPEREHVFEPDNIFGYCVCTACVGSDYEYMSESEGFNIEDSEVDDINIESSSSDLDIEHLSASAVEAFLLNSSALTRIPAETRARISDFILFLHTLPSNQVASAFTNFNNDLTNNFFFNSHTNTNNNSSSGLTDAEIDRLPRYTYRGPTQKELRLREDPHKCCICMADLETGESLILLEKCSHRFHAECLKSWLRRSKQCPICRATIKPPPLVINLID